MNLCFLQGKIIEKIQFEFILDSKNISIAIFNLELTNKSIVKIKAYNELADYCYTNLKSNSEILIYGYISNNDVIAEDII